MKIPRSARRDFKFLTESELHGIGISVGCESVMREDGHTAIEAWFSKDTHGKTIPCCEPELLDLAISGKASWNLQVKEWATDIVSCLLPVEEVKTYCLGYPKWVFKAVINQSKKMAIESIGFVPSYITIL